MKESKRTVDSMILKNRDGDFFIIPKGVVESFAVKSENVDDIQALFEDDVEGQSRWSSLGLIADDLYDTWSESGRPQPLVIDNEIVGIKLSFRF